MNIHVYIPSTRIQEAGDSLSVTEAVARAATHVSLKRASL